MTRRRLLLLTLGVEGGFLLLALALGTVLGTPALGQLKFTWAGWGWGAVGTTPMLAALAWSTRSRWGPFVRLRQQLEGVVAQLFARCGVWDLVFVSVMAGVGEEALFRGVLQTTLADALGPWIALALASAAFGLAHFISTTYAVYAGLVGVYLGLLLLLTGNLLVPLLAHALYDFLALTYLVLLHEPSVPEGVQRQGMAALIRWFRRGR